MKIILLPRQAGKTSQLIAWLEEDRGRLMVVAHLREQNRLCQLYPKLAHQIVTWESYKRDLNMLGRPIKEIVIDNLDLILERECAHQIAAVSLTSNFTTGKAKLI